MPLLDEDSRWPIPAKFRASLDITDEAAYALLQKCDEEQKALGARVNAPFAKHTPQERQRSKAYITIESLTDVAVRKLSTDQRETLAEAYAAVGRFDLAAQTSRVNKKLYKKYWTAVFLDDAHWCEHAASAKFIKEYIFSIREGREVPLLACNVCSLWNVADAPDHLIAARQQRASVRSAAPKPKGMSIMELRDWHHQNVTKGKIL